MQKISKSGVLNTFPTITQRLMMIRSDNADKNPHTEMKKTRN